jgi:hypothetical protein
MTASEYRAMWRSYIRHFSYVEAKVELQQGVAFCRDTFPDGAHRIMVETLHVIGHVKLQWYRLLSWGLSLSS